MPSSAAAGMRPCKAPPPRSPSPRQPARARPRNRTQFLRRMRLESKAAAGLRRLQRAPILATSRLLKTMCRCLAEQSRQPASPRAVAKCPPSFGRLPAPPQHAILLGTTRHQKANGEAPPATGGLAFAADFLGEGIAQADGPVEHRLVGRRIRIAHEITLSFELDD